MVRYGRGRGEHVLGDALDGAQFGDRPERTDGLAETDNRFGDDRGERWDERKVLGRREVDVERGRA